MHNLCFKNIWTKDQLILSLLKTLRVNTYLTQIQMHFFFLHLIKIYSDTI